MVRAATLEKLHGVALILFAALVPVGEGAAFGALGLLGLALILRWRELDARVLLRGAARSVHLGLLVWLAAGAAALMLSNLGWLKPSEVALWSPFLTIPVIVLSAPILDDEWLDRAALAFVIALGVASLYGVAQFLLDARPGEDLFRFNKSRMSQLTVPGGTGNIAGGFFFHRLKMAHVLLPGIGILVARQIFATLAWRRRLVEAALLSLTSVTLLLTFTRGALLAVVVALGAVVAFASNRVRWITVAVALVVGAAAVSVPAIRGRVASIASSEAMQIRGFIWAHGASIIADHPTGVGLGNYPRTVGSYYDLADPHFGVITYPHNIVLAVLAETGPVGLVAFMWMWAGFVVACGRALWRSHRRRRTVAAAAGLFGVVAFWVVGLTHDVLFHKPVNLAFSGMVGWVLAALDREQSGNGR